MKHLKYIVLFGGAMTLQSCFVAKNYERPEFKTEDSYRTEIVAKDSVTMAEMSWKELFTDPVLQQHIQTALQNNFDARIALQNIAAMESNLKQRKAAYLPSISGAANWTHQEISGNSQFGRLFDRVDQYQVNLNLSWEADVWGKIRSGKRAANAQYLQTVAAQQAIQTQVIASVASLYFQLMSMDEQLRVANETLLNRDRSVETIGALKEAGQVNEVAVKQTESQRIATEIIIADLEYNIKIVENTISILLGQEVNSIARGNFNSQVFNPTIETGVPAMLLSKRPDVIAAEFALVNAFELTNVARSNFYPSFTITGSGGFQGLELKNLIDGNSLFATIVSGLTQPIFNQRMIRTQHEIAKTNQEKALIQFEQSLKVAGKEVADALASYENESKKMALRTKQLDVLQKASEYSDELLQYGMVNYLEVITAKDNELNAELGLIDSRLKKIQSVIQLYRALGGGTH